MAFVPGQRVLTKFGSNRWIAAKVVKVVYTVELSNGVIADLKPEDLRSIRASSLRQCNKRHAHQMRSIPRPKRTARSHFRNHARPVVVRNGKMFKFGGRWMSEKYVAIIVIVSLIVMLFVHYDIINLLFSKEKK